MIASFVPKGKAELALAGSVRAKVAEEAIVEGAEAAVDASAEASYERTPSSFDRQSEPPYGAKPEVTVPAVWQAQLGNGLDAYGIEDRELPLARVRIVGSGRPRCIDDIARPGAANLLAQMMMRGTARRTPARARGCAEIARRRGRDFRGQRAFRDCRSHSRPQFRQDHRPGRGNFARTALGRNPSWRSRKPR